MKKEGLLKGVFAMLSMKKGAAFIVCSLLFVALAEASETSADRHGRTPPFALPQFNAPRFPDRTFPITAYGAKPDDSKCTEAIRQAMRACMDAGGGSVVVPPGKWLTGAIRFCSNCNLRLEKGAVLVFTDDPMDYPEVETSWEGVECMNYSPLIYAYGCDNVAITGNGLIAPRMGRWKTWFARPEAHVAATERLYHWCSTNAPVSTRRLTAIKDSNMRPHLIQMNRCRNVLLDGFRICESPFWMIHLYHSEDCIVRNLDTYAHGHNNDGVDIEMSRNVLVEDCRFDQGDDGIVLKAGRNADGWRLNHPTENVVVRNCYFKDAHTLLGIGSELSGGIRNVWMTDCQIESAINMIYLKTNRRRGGFVENVWVENVDCTGNILFAVFGIRSDVIYQWAKFPDYELRYTRISNINVSNVHAKGADWAIDLHGDAHEPPRGICIHNLNVDKFRKGLKRVENCKDVIVSK